jgi:hypothetical protein
MELSNLLRELWKIMTRSHDHRDFWNFSEIFKKSMAWWSLKFNLMKYFTHPERNFLNDE